MVVIALSLRSPAGVQGATIYVRQSGNDAATGTTPATALRTIGRAAGVAQPSERVVVGPGTYAEGNIGPAAFGRVSFIADRRGMETGDPAGDVLVDGRGFAAGFVLNHNIAVTVDGFVISGAPIGVYVKSHSAQAMISNCVIENGTEAAAVYIQDSENATVFNCLIYDNAQSGILITGNTSGSAGARLMNNTVCANGDRGIFFAGTTIGSPAGVVINNIIQGNAVTGVEVNPISRQGYVSAGNVSADRYASGTPVDVTDVSGNALFVNSAGQPLSGAAGYTEDDFHLSQARAGQPVTSPAVDAGSDLARRLGLEHASTRSDGRADGGLVDAGYHYGNFDRPPAPARLRLRDAPLYVSTSGSDLNDGRTPATALQSPARALQLAVPGNRVMLLGGVFHLDPTAGDLSVPTSGRPGRDISIEAMAGAQIDAKGLERGLLIVGKSHITVSGLDVTNAVDSGIEIRLGASDITLEGCHLHGNGNHGLFVSGASAITVQSSLIDHNQGTGMEVEAAQVDVGRTSMVANAVDGLWALNHSTVTLLSSRVADNVTNGVLAWQSVVAITGGTITGSKDGGARFTQGSTGTLSGVNVSGNTDVGVQGISSTVSVSGGTVEGNTRVGIESIVDRGKGGPTQLAVTGTRVCGNQGPGINAQDATAVVLSDVTLCANSAEGLRQVGGTAQILRATVQQNRTKGISLNAATQLSVQNATIDRNGDNGLQVAGTPEAVISGSVMVSNGGDGITILDSPSVQIVNNLVYGNMATGIFLSGDVSGSPDAQVLNNTLFANARGLVIGESNAKPPSQGALALRNILQGNAIVGVQVNQLSLPAYSGDYNLSVDQYFILTPVGFHDILADPMFVDPAHGDFHLMQRVAGQRATSPAVDAGGIDVSTAGLTGLTTRTDGRPDTGIVDLGYHYKE